MPHTRNLQPVPIGLVSDQPLRLEGLVSIFNLPATGGRAAMLPMAGTLPEMLADTALDYLVIDVELSSDAKDSIDAVRRVRPGLHIIVIGPAGNDEMVLEAIISGARAYLDITADAAQVRQAIDVVTSGSIWAPRRLLSKLIDRLLKTPDSSLTNAEPHLTDREKDVLEHILLARSNREIARLLGIEERTVKAHVGRLMRKTGADNRIELTMRAINHSLFPRKHQNTYQKAHPHSHREPLSNPHSNS